MYYDVKPFSDFKVYYLRNNFSSKVDVLIQSTQLQLSGRVFRQTREDAVSEIHCD